MTDAIILSGPVDWLLATAAVITALTIILKPVRAAAFFLIALRDDWQNIAERLDALEQLRPNGGSSVADHISQLRDNQTTIIGDLAEMREAIRDLQTRGAP